MEENIQNKEQKKNNFTLKQILSGNILIQESIKKHIWYILFVVFLAVLYINNKYKTESILIEMIKLRKEITVLRNRSISYASELMSISRESEVIKMVDEKEVGLEELKMPPQKIVVKKQQ